MVLQLSVIGRFHYRCRGIPEKDFDQFFRIRGQKNQDIAFAFEFKFMK